jgi:hypothetical protein
MLQAKSIQQTAGGLSLCVCSAAVPMDGCVSFHERFANLDMHVRSDLFRTPGRLKATRTFCTRVQQPDCESCRELSDVFAMHPVKLLC